MLVFFKIMLVFEKKCKKVWLCLHVRGLSFGANVSIRKNKPVFASNSLRF